MRVVLSSRGSRGDVYPIIAIAAELARRGHRVDLCLPPLYARLCEAHQLPMVRYKEDSEAVMQSFDTGWRAARQALRWFSASIDEQFQVLGEATRTADALVTSVNEVAGPSVAQHRGLPHFRVAYAPVLPGSHPPPLQPHQQLPAVVNRLMWLALNRSSKLLFGRQLDRQRAKLGLPPLGDFGDYCAGHSHNLLCFSPTLAPPDPAWHYRHSYTGYCFSEDEGALDPALERFVADGPPPIYIGFGSTCVRDPQRVSRMIHEAVLRAGVRTIVGRGWTGLGGDAAARRFLFHLEGEAPHATLFPRLGGIAHHGGSGTLHNAARAGIPQLLMPQFADQYYWAHRVHALGLGPAPIPTTRLTPRRLARALRALVEQPGHALRARALAPVMGQERGVETAVAAITGEPVAARDSRAACA